MQVPTVGRKVWLWVPSEEFGVIRDNHQAFDATVIFVNGDGTITVTAFDHQGNNATHVDVLLEDPEDGNQHCQEGSEWIYATWMPYQKAQHDKQT